MELINNNIINIEIKSGVSIIIPINNKVNIITGDSATGKTKMVSYLDTILEDTSEVTKKSVDLSNIIICKDEKSVKEYIKQDVKNKIFIIDRFDTMSDDREIIDFMDESSNIFIVCAHKSFEQCGYSTDSMLGLKHDGMSYEAYKLFETPADYMRNRSVLI